MLNGQAEVGRPGSPCSLAVDALCNFEQGLSLLGLSFPKPRVLSSCFIHLNTRMTHITLCRTQQYDGAIKKRH